MRVASGSRGFALVSVMWMLVVVGAVSVSIHAGARTHRRGTINAGAQARARWAAREALARTLDSIDRQVVARGDWEAVGLGRATPIDLGTGIPDMVVSVETVDARGRLNLNRASSGEIESLLAAIAGGRTPSVLTLRDRILDWRDPDHQKRYGGAEAPDYARAGRPARVADGPFESVLDLAEVEGVTPGVMAALVPLTTIAGDGTINVNAAPPAVLATLPGVDLRTARLLVSARARRPFNNVFDMIRALPRDLGQTLETQATLLQERVAFGPRDIEIRVTARPAGSGLTVRLYALVSFVSGGKWEVRSVRES